MDLEKDVKDFHFRQLRKVNIALPTDSAQQKVSLLAVASTYGLTCVGTTQGLFVFQTAILQEINSDQQLGRNPAPRSSLKAVSVPLPAPPLCLALSADQNYLCVCISIRQNLTYIFYDLPSLYATKGTCHPIGTQDIKSAANVSPTCNSIQWNPEECPDLVASCLSSGEIIIMKIPAGNDSVQVTNRASIQASSLCWSPKGKQIAVGLQNGTILQLGMDLKKKREIPFPDVLSGEKTQVIVDLHWISTYEFIAAYSSIVGPDSRAGGLPPASKILTLTIEKDKSKPPVCRDFDDPCYASGFNYYHFFFSCIQQWKVIICGSSSAVDVPVFGQNETNKNWYKWDLDDTQRPEVPLSDSGDECYVAGMALDYSSVKNVELNDVRTLPPCPLLLILSTGGTLMPYTIINEKCPDDELMTLVRPPHPLPVPLSSPSPPHVSSSVASGSVPRPSGTATTVAASLGFSVSAIQQQMPNQQGTGQTGLPNSGDPRSQILRTSQVGQPQTTSPAMTPPTSVTIPKFSLGSSPVTTAPAIGSAIPTAPMTSSAAPIGTSPLSHIPHGTIPLGTVPLSHMPRGLGTSPLAMIHPGPTGQRPAQSSSASVRPPPPGPPPLGPSPMYRPPGTPVGVPSVPRPVLTSTPHVRPPGIHPSPPVNPNTGPPPSTTYVPHGQHPATTPTVTKPIGGVPATVPLIRQDTQSINEDHDSNYSGYIEKEMQKFQDEMASLKGESYEVIALWEKSFLPPVSSDQTGMQTQGDIVEVETSQLEKTVEKQNQNTKALFDDVRFLGDKVLKGFELAEEARVRLLHSSDPQHTMLCRKQPLDPHRARRMDEIRSRYALIDQKLTEVNGQLDSELEKKTNSHRSKGRTPMKDPRSLDIYTALRSHKNVLRAQSNTLNDLTNQMKSLRLISRSWRPVSIRDSTQCTTEPVSTACPTSHHTSFHSTQDSETPYSSPAEKKRMKLLMEQLKKIEVTPKRVVRRDFTMHLGTMMTTPPQGSVPSRSSSVTEDTNSVVSQPPDGTSEQPLGSGGGGGSNMYGHQRIGSGTHLPNAGGIPSYLMPVIPNQSLGGDGLTGAYITDGYGHIVGTSEKLYFSGIDTSRTPPSGPGTVQQSVYPNIGPGTGGVGPRGPEAGGQRPSGGPGTEMFGPGAGGQGPSGGPGTGRLGPGGPGAGGQGPSGGPGTGMLGPGGPGAGGQGPGAGGQGPSGGPGTGRFGPGGLGAGGQGPGGGPGTGMLGPGGPGTGGQGPSGGPGTGRFGPGGLGIGGQVPGGWPGTGMLGPGGPGAGGQGPSGGPGTGMFGPGGPGAGGQGPGAGGQGPSGGPGTGRFGPGGPGAGGPGTGMLGPGGPGAGGQGPSGGPGTGRFGPGGPGAGGPGTGAPSIGGFYYTKYPHPLSTGLPLPSSTIGSAVSLSNGEPQTTVGSSPLGIASTKPLLSVSQPLFGISQPQTGTVSYPLGSVSMSSQPVTNSGSYRSTVEWGKPPSTGSPSYPTPPSLAMKTQPSNQSTPPISPGMGMRPTGSPVPHSYIPTTTTFTTGSSPLLSALLSKPMAPPITGSGAPPIIGSGAPSLLPNPSGAQTPLTSSFSPAVSLIRPGNQFGPGTDVGGGGGETSSASCSQPGLVTVTLAKHSFPATSVTATTSGTSTTMTTATTSSVFPFLGGTKPFGTTQPTVTSIPSLTTGTVPSNTSSSGATKPVSTSGILPVSTALHGTLPSTSIPSTVGSLGSAKPVGSIPSTVAKTPLYPLGGLSSQPPFPASSTKNSIPLTKSVSFTPGATAGFSFGTGKGTTNPTTPSGGGTFVFGSQKPPATFSAQLSLPVLSSTPLSKLPYTPATMSSGQPLSSIAAATTSSIHSLATAGTTSGSTLLSTSVTQPSKGTQGPTTTASAQPLTVASTLIASSTKADGNFDESNTGNTGSSHVQLSSSRPGSSLSLPQSEHEKTSQDKPQETKTNDNTTQPSAVSIASTSAIDSLTPVSHSQTATSQTQSSSNLLSSQLSNDKPVKQDFFIPTTDTPAADQTSSATSVVSKTGQASVHSESRPSSGEGAASKKDSGSSTSLNQQNMGNSDVEGEMEADEDLNLISDVPDTDPLAGLGLGSATPSGPPFQRNPFGGSGPLSSSSQPNLLGSQSSQQSFGLLQPSKFASGLPGTPPLQRTSLPSTGTGLNTASSRGMGASPLSNVSLPSFGSLPQFGGGGTQFGSGPILGGGEVPVQNQPSGKEGWVFGGGGSQMQQQDTYSSFGALAGQGGSSVGGSLGGGGTMDSNQFMNYRS